MGNPINHIPMIHSIRIQNLRSLKDTGYIGCSFNPSNPANTNFHQYISNLAGDAAIFPMLSNNLLKDAIDYMKSHSDDIFQLLECKRPNLGPGPIWLR